MEDVCDDAAGGFGPPEASPPPEPVASPDLADLDALRSGDMSAISALYRRHHAAALRTALGVAGPSQAEDLVAEAFTKVLASVLHGHGPDRQFRAYIAATIRNLHIDAIRRGSHELLVPDTTLLDRLQPDESVEFLEEGTVVEVLSTLPPRWREILWRTIILGEPLNLAGTRMGLNANAAAALNFRARAGLRKAYAQWSGTPEDVDVAAIRQVGRRAAGGA